MPTRAPHTDRYRWRLTRLVIVLAASAMLPEVASPGIASAAEGSAPAGCAQTGSVYSSIDACVSQVVGRGRGSDPLSFKHLSGTATVTETDQYYCWSSVTTSTGVPAYFAVTDSHTATAVFAMTGQTVTTSWSEIDPDTGEMTCSSDFTTTPIDPWQLSVAWTAAGDDPTMDVVCFSVAPCGTRVPREQVYRHGK